VLNLNHLIEPNHSALGPPSIYFLDSINGYHDQDGFVGILRNFLISHWKNQFPDHSGISTSDLNFSICKVGLCVFSCNECSQ
jgi:hypothetical protein